MRRNTEASQLTDALSSGDPADAEFPVSKLRNRSSARGREQIAPTNYPEGAGGVWTTEWCNNTAVQ
jgi:hypothetical protein